MKKSITVHVESVESPWTNYGPSYRVDVWRAGRKTPLWSSQYGGLDMGDGHGAADLAYFAGHQVKRQFELGLNRR